MANLRCESPLQWPGHLPVTPRGSQRGDHGFPVPLTLAESIGYLTQELNQLHATGILFLDIEQPLIERLSKKVGSRTGACLHLKYQGTQYVFACDRWIHPEHNIYAMHLALRQWRNIDRWGIGTLPSLFKGFEAQRQKIDVEDISGEDLASWMRVFGLGPTATLEDAVAIYHRRAKQVAHDVEALTSLNLMMDEVRSYFATRHG